MKNTALLLLALSFLVATPVASWASTINVVPGSTITLNGSFNGKNTSYLNDGAFAATGSRWSKDSVWWLSGASSIEIELNGEYRIDGMSIQADSNDQYRVEYWDSASGSWRYAWTVENMKTAENNWQSGLVVRNTTSPLDIVSDKIRITASSGDNHFSVSEVQAYGAKTPIPGAVFILGAGLGCLGVARRFFHGRK